MNMSPSAKPQDASPDPIRVDRLTSLDQLESLRSDWSSLHLSLKPGSLHSDMDWYCMILRAMAPDYTPLVLSFRKEGRLVGLVAGYRHTREIPLRLGYLRLGRVRAPAWSINYQGILAGPDASLYSRIAEAMFLEISNSETDVVYTNALPVGDPIYQELSRCQEGRGLCLALNSEPHMMVQLHGSADETIAKLGPNVRSSFRRILKKNRNAPAAEALYLRTFSRPEEVEAFFTDAEEVAGKTYQRALRVGFARTPLHRMQADLAAQKGWFRGHILYHGKKPVAFQEDYVYGTHCFNPYIGYDAKYRSLNPGSLLLALSWEVLIRETQARIYDFGLGDGDYKRRIADIFLCEREFLMFRNTVRYRALRRLLLLNMFANRAVRRLLDLLGIYHRVKTFWRKKKASSLDVRPTAGPSR